MTYSLKNIFSVKSAVSLMIIVFIFGFFPGRQAKAISITSDPAVSNLKATTATIYWPTDENGDSTVYYTANSPAWQTQNSGLASANIYAISGIKNEIWAIGGAGKVTYTLNGGKNWQPQTNTNTNTFYDIEALDASHVWAVGTNGAIIFYNGISWTTQNSGVSNTLRSVSALDSSHVWAVGYGGTVLFFDGNSWASLNTGIAANLRGVSVLDDSHVWVVGYGGKILFYNGSVWAEQNSGTPVDLFAIYAYDFSHIWTVGASGKILFYNGLIWTAQNSGIISDLYGVYSIDQTHAWTAGANGKVLYTTDGFTWLQRNRIEEYDDVYAVRDSQIWLVGVNNLIEFYGISYDSTNYNSTQTAVHQMVISGLAPSTKYYYYVCSKNSATPPQEVCSNDYEFTTLGVCPDGTYAGLCNGTQYCDPGLSPPQLVYNCNKCSYTCAAPNIFCNTGNGSCQPGCNLTTPVGSCSGTQYCQSAGTFVNDCRQCGYTCAAPNIYCNLGNGSCQPGCNLTTPVGSCSGTQYCQSAGSLVNNCDKCLFSCPASDPYCDKVSASPTYGQCQKKCSDGTPGPGCNIVTKQYCDDSFVLHTDCGTNITRCAFACPASTPFCDGTNCIARCSDGTQVGQCSGNLYCTSALQLEQWCNYCGNVCPSAAPYCDTTTHLCDAGKCVDGTAIDGCNANQQYCDPVSKTLINNCNKCGYACPSAAPYCNLSGICEAKCPDGTILNACSSTQWCNPANFTLENNCTKCGYACPAASSYCNTGSGVCEGKCSDGTARGDCNLATKQYCNAALQLVNDCRQCGYACPAATPQCEEDSGACVADLEPPVISNINITDITDNSAVLTFITNEPAQADVIVLLNADCTLLYKLIYSGDFYTSFNILMSDLLPQTTYYLNIGVWDDNAEASNFTSTGCPSSISFKTAAEPDTTLPTVEIITPAEDEKITSPFYNITLSAVDNAGIKEVKLILDGQNLAYLTSASEYYEYNFVAGQGQFLPGPHQLEATATDTSDNTASFGPRAFVIVFDSVAPVITEIKTDIGFDEATNSHRAVITWKTDEPATSRIDYVIENENGSYSEDYGNDEDCTNIKQPDCVKNDALVTSHQIELKNLEANRRYHYRLTACDANNNCSH